MNVVIRQSPLKKKYKREIIYPYYLEILDCDVVIGCSDSDISRLLDVTTEEYQKIMVKEYYAFRDGIREEIYFVNIESAERAINWMEAMLVSSKLRGVM